MTLDYRPSLVRSFERHLRAENRSEHTIASYLESLRQAEAFLAGRGRSLVDARREDLEAFLGDCSGAGHRRPSPPATSGLGGGTACPRRGDQPCHLPAAAEHPDRDRPIARGAALTAGGAIVLIVVSTIGVLVGDTGFSTNDTPKAAINIAFGALLLAVGLRALLRPPKPKRPRPTRNHPASADPSWRARAAWRRTSRPSPSTPRRWP